MTARVSSVWDVIIARNPRYMLVQHHACAWRCMGVLPGTWEARTWTWKGLRGGCVCTCIMLQGDNSLHVHLLTACVSYICWEQCAGSGSAQQA